MDVSQLAIIVVVALVNLGLALAVYLRNRRSASNRAFAAAVVAIVCWLAFAYLSDLPQLADYALLLNRLTFASAMWMGAFLLRFAIIFPSREARLPLPWRPLHVVRPVPGRGYPDHTARRGRRPASGPGAPTSSQASASALLVGWAVTGVIGCVVTLASKYRAAEGRERTQLKFMLLGFAGFALSSVLFGLILPSVTGNYETCRTQHVLVARAGVGLRLRHHQAPPHGPSSGGAQGVHSHAAAARHWLRTRVDRLPCRARSLRRPPRACRDALHLGQPDCGVRFPAAAPWPPERDRPLPLPRLVSTVGTAQPNQHLDELHARPATGSPPCSPPSWPVGCGWASPVSRTCAAADRSW